MDLGVINARFTRSSAGIKTETWQRWPSRALRRRGYALDKMINSYTTDFE